jgi:diguanylate cyclase (GGDEF)-like protein/PAS domain S-box-containing protein
MQDAVSVTETPEPLALLLCGRLVDRLPAAVYAALAGESGEWLYVSPRIADILGYPAQDFIADPSLWASLVHPDDRAWVFERDTEDDPYDRDPIEYRMRRRDGQTVWVLDDSELGPYGGHAKVHHGLLYDITERKRNDLLLAAQADLLDQLVSGNEIRDVLARLAGITEQVSGAATCLIELYDSRARRAAGIPSAETLTISSSGAAAIDAVSVEGMHEAEFAVGDHSPAGRVVLRYRPGAVVPIGDSELVRWSARIAAVAAERGAQHAQVAESLALLAATLESTADGILVLDGEHRVVGHNRKFLDMWQISPDSAEALHTAAVQRDAVQRDAVQRDAVQRDGVDALLQRAARLLPAATGPAFLQLDRPGRDWSGNPAGSGPVLDEIELIDGRIFERYQHIHRGISNEHNIGRVWSFRDVTAHRLLKLELERNAFSDSLTPLANRRYFVTRLTEALASETDRPAVLVLDLDDFKTVNDGLGYAAGDRLLIAVANRVRGCLRTGDTAARLGGDEFVVLLEDVAGEREAVFAAERILAAVSRPITIDGQVLTVRASVGITVHNEGEDAADLLRNADLAKNVAKRDGGSCCRRYSPEMHADALARVELKTDLERAINSEQLTVHYQPVVDLASGRILGVEALARWEHPVRGHISPVEFIPLAEQTGLIERLGRWVLRQACADTALWRSTIAGQEDLTVSVNLSPRQLSNSQFPEEVRRVLWASGLAANGLILEITESTLAEPGVDTVQSLQELKEIGLSLALDDFGTGYSSLAQLVQYPLDVVKVDKSFVDIIDGQPANSALTQAVLSVAEALSLSVTVEGIETEQQLEVLVAMGARRGQGYLMARPLPAGAVRLLLEAVTVAGIAV